MRIIEKLGYILILIAYMPQFYIEGIEQLFCIELDILGEIFNSIFSILITGGITIILISKYFEKKNVLILPLFLLFLYLTIIFTISIFGIKIINDYAQVFTVISSIVICYLIYSYFLLFFRIRRKRK